MWQKHIVQDTTYTFGTPQKELARDPLIMKCTTVHIGISRFSFDAL